MTGSPPSGIAKGLQRARVALGERFDLEARGPVDVKGKGPMSCWLLLAERE